MNHDVMKAPAKEQALQELLSAWTCMPQTEHCSLEECLGRVTAEDVFSINTIPMMRISAMDGFAVKSEAFAEGIPDVSKWVLDTDFAPADTGDDFPDEYDSVIAVEQLHYDDNGQLMLEDGFTFQKNSNIRPAGCIMQKGDLLVRKNVCITPELQANLAVGGISSVPVIRKPVVAFIPTGSELVEVGSIPQRGQNIECNSLLISAYLKKWGADVIRYPIVHDDPKSLEEALDTALESADIVILNGGSSKGTEDYTSRMMESKASYFMHTVRTVPGRPVGISIIQEKPVINMPGPTMAAWVVSDWLIHPMICHYFAIPVKKRQTVHAFLTEDLRKGPPVEVYTKVRLENRGGIYYATPLERSARSSESLRDGIGVLIAPIGSLGFHKGQPVSVELLTDETQIEVTQEMPHIQLPENCTQCGNHCPASELKCGRGKAYYARLRNGEEFQCENETVNMLVKCAQGAQHFANMRKQKGQDPDGLLSALTEEEQVQLLALLKKQQDHWNAEHAQRIANQKRR